MKLSESFSTDDTLSSDGKWFSLGGEAGVKIARFGNPKHRKIMERLREPFQAFILSGKEIPEKDNHNIIKQSLAEGVLLDWKGFQNEDGENLEYTLDNAIQAFNSYPDFLDMVSTLALEASNFRTKVKEEVVKNS